MWIAFWLGLVEGLTEFLPVSSTGHLILAGQLLGFTGDKASTFEIFIQLGAILAVLCLYRERFLELFDFSGQGGFHGKRGLALVAWTSMPVLIAGFLGHGAIKTYLFSPITVAIGLGIGGVALILLEIWLKRREKEHEKRVHDLNKLSLRQAVGIGCFQILALWPGVSRSGATIMGGMILGLDRKAAVEYSFLAAVPVMLVATTYELMKSLRQLGPSDIPVFGVGFVVAFVTAVVAIKSFVHLVRNMNFIPFGIYRIGVAVLILVIWFR